MSKIKILKIHNCFQCHYHGIKFLKGYICERNGKTTNPWIWNNEFPSFCQLPSLENFLEYENKIKELKDG